MTRFKVGDKVMLFTEAFITRSRSSHDEWLRCTVFTVLEVMKKPTLRYGISDFLTTFAEEDMRLATPIERLIYAKIQSGG